MKSKASKVSRASSSSSNSMRSKSNSPHDQTNSSSSIPSEMNIVGESTPPQNTVVAPQQTPTSLGGSENPSHATPKEGDASDQVSKEEAILESLKSHERSTVWEHFERKIEGGRVKGLCKYCAQSDMADSDKNVITNLRNHIARCRSYGPDKEIFAANMQKILTFAGTKDKLEAIGFSQEEVTKACVEMIIIDKLHFTFVEEEGFRRFCMQACPMWRVPSRKTIANDVLSLFYSEKDKLKSQ